MGRRRTHAPLHVFLNNRLVGRLSRESSGAVEFQYDPSWLGWSHAIPTSLSLPLREDRYVGAPVSAVFENLLPDSEPIRRRVAERVGAKGTDAHSLLTRIGRDCVGALQFLPDGLESVRATDAIEADPITESEVSRMIQDLKRAPLGLDEDDDFRISIAGAQEKTALLRKEGRWFKPRGTTATTHILKPQIGNLPGGIDLSNSVENEFYCLRLLEALDFKVNRASIEEFEGRKVLVLERFDRRWTQEGRLLRLPQEDCCQALSVPPAMKYQNQGGPGIRQVVELLKGSDEPITDSLTFLRAQILFWMIGATDGHAKNFSIFLYPGGRYHMTPMYDVLTSQPNFDRGEMQSRSLKLAMSVGDSRHYRIDDIMGRHFIQSGLKAGMARPLIEQAMTEIRDRIPGALDSVEKSLPGGFPESIHASVSAAVKARVGRLKSMD